jgi:lysophospholipase L1-like esterase
VRGLGRQPVQWGAGLGGASAVAAAIGVGVLAAQARMARRAIGRLHQVPPYQDGRFGPSTGTSIRLAVLGDSAAAGLGADAAADTVSGVIVRGVLSATGRPVLMTNHAVVGARSADLDRQVTRALSQRPHVAVIIVGANDVTNLVPIRVSVAHLVAQVQRLRGAGCAVVVGTCPDLGTIRPVGPPLRNVARRASRVLADAQRRAVEPLGAAAVDIHTLLGPGVRGQRRGLLRPDRFHPSGLGYRRIGLALLPAVLAALGVQPDLGRRAITAAPAPS